MLIIKSRPPPHCRHVGISVDDNIELELGTDGEGETEVWRNVNVELVFLLRGTKTLDCILIFLVRLQNRIIMTKFH